MVCLRVVAVRQAQLAVLIGGFLLYKHSLLRWEKLADSGIQCPTNQLSGELPLLELCWEGLMATECGAEPFLLVFGIFKFLKTLFLAVSYRNGLELCCLQVLGSLFSLFRCGRFANISDCSYTLLVQV